MYSYCVACFQSKDSSSLELCPRCSDQLQLCLPDEHSYSIFVYEGLMRDLILRTKISGDQKALKVLIELVVNSEEIQVKILQANYLMPAPSSFWGRIRGRIDIPYFVCLELSKKYEIPIMNPPRKLFWKFKKQSQRVGRISNLPEEIKDTQNECILIIDDIVTTGHTLKRLVAEITGYSYSFLTLAAR